MNRVTVSPNSNRLAELRARIESREARIGIVGMGYVGLPLALLFSGERFRVTGFDIAPDKVRALNAGDSYRSHSACRYSGGATGRLPRNV